MSSIPPAEITFASLTSQIPYAFLDAKNNFCCQSYSVKISRTNDRLLRIDAMIRDLFVQRASQTKLLSVSQLDPKLWMHTNELLIAKANYQ